MTKRNKTTKAALAATLMASSLALSPFAFADPDTDNVGTPHLTTAPTADIEENPLVPITVPDDQILNVAVLPLFDKANWKPVNKWDWGSPWLTGVEICSPEGIPPAPSDDVPWAPTTDVQHVVLAPGDNGNPDGWTATVSFAPYASQTDSIGALHSYKVYVEHCPLLNTEAKVQRGGNVARNDPTLAHGIVVTHGHYMEMFVVALPTGLVELAVTHPTDAGQVEFPYSPAQVFASLRGANVRPADRGPFGWGR